MNLEKVRAFYDLRPEELRLDSGIGPLERERTRRLLARHLPARPPRRVADVGGGAGEYALWLAAQGHRVDCFDLMERHVAITRARDRAAPAGARLLRIEQADARALPAADASYDQLLLHGPLYHLPEKADRLAALTEARRVLAPGGALLAFGISSTASAIYGLARGAIFEPNYLEMVEREVRSGRHIPPLNFPRLFVEGHFHRPGELEAELTAAGFAITATLAVETSAWLVPDFPTAWADPAKREIMLAAADLLETDAYNSPHFVVVATATAC